MDAPGEYIEYTETSSYFFPRITRMLADGSCSPARERRDSKPPLLSSVQTPDFTGGNEGKGEGLLVIGYWLWVMGYYRAGVSLLSPTTAPIEVRQ